MLKLLREDQLAGAIKPLGKKFRSVSIAAPFWGDGAAHRLGLKKGWEVRVLCRFESAACNPTELLQLLKIGATIRSHQRLHAKIYIAGKTAIVGSSNPSRSGLTQEGDVTGGWVEANVITDDPDLVTDIEALFDELWGDKRETVKITRRMVEREIEHRASAPPPTVPRNLTRRTLLAACREAPELFGSVVVCAYDEDLGRNGKQVLAHLKKQAATGVDLDVSSFHRCWGYQFDDPPPAGTWIVDLDCKRSAPFVHGASQVPSPALRLKVDGEYDLMPTVRGVVGVPGAFGTFRISSEEKRQLVGIARTLLEDERSFIPLSEVVAKIDRARAKSRKSSNA